MTTRKGPDRVAILNADGTFDDPKVYEKLGEHFGELSEETIQDVEDLKTLTEEGRLSEPSLNATYVAFRNHDGTPVTAPKVVIITLTVDGSDIDNIAVYDDITEVGA